MFGGAQVQSIGHEKVLSGIGASLFMLLCLGIMKEALVRPYHLRRHDGSSPESAPPTPGSGAGPLRDHTSRQIHMLDSGFLRL